MPADPARIAPLFNSRSESVLATALVVLSLGLFAYQGQSLFAPIVHEQHNWRQADVYSVAFSFHQDGFDWPRLRLSSQ